MKQAGGKLTKELFEKYQKSPNWINGRFMNLEETNMQFNLVTVPKMLYKQFFETKGRQPKQKLPIMDLDMEEFIKDSEYARFVWYGHSVVLLRIKGKTILIDPMLGSNASPTAPFETKRFFCKCHR